MVCNEHDKMYIKNTVNVPPDVSTSMTYIPGTGPQVRGRMLPMIPIQKRVMLMLVMLKPIPILHALSPSSLRPGCPSAPPPVARHTWRLDSPYTQNMWGSAVTGGTLGHYNYLTIIHWDTRIIGHWNTGTLENSTFRY